MDKKPEDSTPHNPVEDTAPKAEEKLPEAPKVESTDETKVDDSISRQELEELKHRAEVSSQNFERAKKAEEELKKLKTQEVLEDTEVLPEYEDEEVSALKEQMAEVKAELNKANLLKRHPELEEVWGDFESFREDPENKGMNLNTSAKAFRIEKGLAEPKRKGLEKSSGGDRVPISSGLSQDKVADLRKNDYPKYREMLKKGMLKVDD